MPNLTERRRRILAALAQHLAEHGQLPTAEQLTAAAGMRSPSVAREELGWLLLNGYLKHDDTQPGGIRIVEGGPA